MLIFDMATQLSHARLQNVRGGSSTGRNAPSAAVEEQRRLWLCPCKTELSSIGALPPRRGVDPERAQALRNIVFVEPVDRAACFRVRAFRSHESDGTGTV